MIDAEFALNEGGGGCLKNGKRVSNNVQASEKVYQSFRLEVTNPGGHSSLPLKDNAITHLAEGLARIGAYDFPVKLNEVTRTYFERSAGLVSPEIGTAMRSILRDPTDPAALEKLSPIPAYNSRLRTTCVATMLEAGHAENALPQRARSVVDDHPIRRLLRQGGDAAENRTLPGFAALHPSHKAAPAPSLLKGLLQTGKILRAGHQQNPLNPLLLLKGPHRVVNQG